MSRKDQKEGSGETAPRSDDVSRHLSKGRLFTEELLRENERLRYKILHLHQELAMAQNQAQGPPQDIREENARLKAQLEEIRSSFETLKRENDDFLTRYHSVEKENENLLNLYVAGFQLHSTMEEDALRQTIHEIILNLVGADVFALWLVNQETGALEVASRVDMANFLPPAMPSLPALVVEEMAAGRNWFPQGTAGMADEPLACIPLRIGERTLGALSIYKLLEQKGEGFTPVDHELLALLGKQAAAALAAARIFRQSGVELRCLSPREGAQGALGS